MVSTQVNPPKTEMEDEVQSEFQSKASNPTPDGVLEEELIPPD